MGWGWVWGGRVEAGMKVEVMGGGEVGVEVRGGDEGEGEGEGWVVGSRGGGGGEQGWRRDGGWCIRMMEM